MKPKTIDIEVQGLEAATPLFAKPGLTAAAGEGPGTDQVRKLGP